MAASAAPSLDDKHKGELHELLDFAIEIAEADFADVRLVDPATGRLRLAAQRGFPPEWSAFWAAETPGPGPCLLALQRGARLVVEDIRDDALVAQMPATRLLRRLGIRGLQSTPIVARSGAVLGTFSTHSSLPCRPDARARRLLDILARQAADMIERNHAEAVLAASEERRLFLVEIEDALRPLADPAEVEWQACRRLAERLGAARTYFLQVDEDAGSLRVERDFTRPGVASIVGTYPIALHEWALSILRRDACVVVSDLRASTIVPDAARDALVAHGTASVISVPLVKAGRLVGAINVSDTRPRDWSAAEFALVRDVGERIWAAAERARSDTARRDGEELFGTLFDQSPQAMAIAAYDGFFLNCNRSFLDLVGYDLEELRRMKPSSLFHPDDREANLAEAARLRRGEVASFQITNRYVHKSGRAVWVDKSVGAIRGRHWFVIMATDVTERRQVDEATARARKVAALGQLSGGIAHDFNNLLMAISLNLEMAQTHAEDEELRGELAEAKDAVAKGAALTRRMLSFAQRGVLRAERFAPGARAREVAHLLRRSLGEQVEISVAVDADPWLVEADIGELDSALINLAVNARDAMPGGGRLAISVDNAMLGEHEARRFDLAPGPHVRIRIADTGTGMDPEVLRRATEPFFTTKPQGQGTGLGLSSVYGFVRQSGGGLGIESRPRQGTTVTLMLPRASPMVAAAEARAGDDIPAGNGERVLVVEDNDQVRRALAGRLRMLGYDAVEAGRGAEATAMLEGDATIRLVVSDVVMPGGVDGFDVADWARANRPDVGVLLVSGNMATDPRREAHPGLHVLAKPCGIAELARKLHEALVR